jgi:hypothetical protein
MVIERWHGVHQIRELANGIVSLDPLLRPKEAPRVDGKKPIRRTVVWATNSMAWTACRDTMSAPDSKLRQALAGREDFSPEFQASPPRRSHSHRATAVLQMHFICELTQSF